MEQKVQAGIQQAISHPLAGPPPAVAAAHSPDALNVAQFMGREVPEKKKGVEDMPTTMEALAELVGKERWVEVITLSSRITPDGMEEELRLKLARVLALTKRKAYQDAANEFATLKPLDDTTYRYETYEEKYQGKKGSMVPFSLEMLFAVLPHFLGNTRTSIDRLFHLLHVCSENIAALESKEEESERDLTILVGPYLARTRRASTWSEVLKSESNAVSVEVNSQPGRAPHFLPQEGVANILDGLAADEGGATKAKAVDRGTLEDWRNRELRVIFVLVNLHIMQKEFSSAVKLLEYLNAYSGKDPTLLYNLGLVFLQMGNLRAAEDIFDKVECLASDDHAINFNLSRGLLNVCQGNFRAAVDDFQAAVEDNPKNIAAVNNLAIARLYVGQLHKAIETLEILIKKYPEEGLTDSIVFNLATLYDLSCHRSTEKKELIRNIAREYAVGDIDMSMFKI